MRSILITMLLLLSGAAQALVVDFEEYVGLGVFQPVTTIESQGFLFTDYAGSYMMVVSWTWGLIPLVAPLVGDVALYIPDDNDPLDPLLSTVRYSWLIGGLMAKKVLVFIAELLVGKAWEGWCDAQMIPGGGAAGTQMLR